MEKFYKVTRGLLSGWLTGQLCESYGMNETTRPKYGPSLVFGSLDTARDFAGTVLGDIYACMVENPRPIRLMLSLNSMGNINYVAYEETAIAIVKHFWGHYPAIPYWMPVKIQRHSPLCPPWWPFVSPRAHQEAWPNTYAADAVTLVRKIAPGDEQ